MVESRWKVGPTQSTTYSSAQRYGYGFTITSFRGAPLLSVTFEKEAECREAEQAVRKALEKAVDIMGYSGI